MKKATKDNIIYIYLLIYSVVSGYFLVQFPFMHSDESWLSGLTNSMMSNGLATTESFFDILPRYPHAIKIIFHFIQMTAKTLFGDSLFAYRLISLLFGIFIIYLVYKIGKIIFKNELFSIIVAVVISLDIQFIYASHFARQEIIILFGMLLAFYLLIKNIDNFSLKNNITIGVILGLLIGIHPNSFIVALVIGVIYLYFIFINKKLKIRDLLILVGIVFSFALVFVVISYIFDSNFISNYLKYGSELGVTESIGKKGIGIIDFYKKIYYQITGTYYLPNIKTQLVLFAFSIILAIISCFKDRKYLLFLLPVVAINIGYIIIGRYSQPSILFIFPFMYVLAFLLINDFSSRFKRVSTYILFIVIIINSFAGIAPYVNNDYDIYITTLYEQIPQDVNVLVNINGLYAFDTDKVFDYRNLNYLDESNLTIEEYIKKNDIEYIVYPQEIDYIYDNRPTWNILYGNVYPYYNDMYNYIKNNCEAVYSFYSPYAMRIERYMYTNEWKIVIFKVKD